ncbi:hypothetical protein K439DRAFT_1625790 [Ramaria rubella]|nr:hypothetical protein K439DRAFT_1625790 [Ramaria rubella]
MINNLWCFILGDGELVEVKLLDVVNIYNLKKRIKEEGSNGMFAKIDAINLTLWKLNEAIPIVPGDTLSSRIDSLGDDFSTFARKLSVWTHVADLFADDSLSDYVQIIVQKPPNVIQSPGSVSLSSSHNKNLSVRDNITKKWNVNGAIRTIDIPGCYFTDPMEQTEMMNCLARIHASQYTLLAGARASGKSTRLHRLKEILRHSHVCLMVSFTQFAYKDGNLSFWKSVGDALNVAARNTIYEGQIKPITSSHDFQNNFSFEALKDNHIVLLIDELSEIHIAKEDIRDDFLRTCRAVREQSPPSAIQSIVGAGTFSILNLKLSNSSMSPFNISDNIPVCYFTLAQCQKLFRDFADDNSILFPDRIIEDVWALSNGHPGMVGLCGRTLSNNLVNCMDQATKSPKLLSYTRWTTLLANFHYEILQYPTFKAMLDSLLTEAPEDALKLLRSRFIGHLDAVALGSDTEQRLADFLTAEGVLIKELPTTKYRMTSALIDGFIRNRIIPEKFPAAPSSPLQYHDGGRIDVLHLLTEATKFFEKELIRSSFKRSYKLSTVEVGGLVGCRVPRESVYDTELMRILINWLVFGEGYKVTGQWHLRTDAGRNKYSDIVIELENYTIVLELLATGDVTFVRDHIQKTPEYQHLLSADEAWVVHFTCQDNYQPIWPSDQEMQEGLNMVHFCHDLDFTSMSFSARWMDVDKNMQSINNRLLEI